MIKNKENTESYSWGNKCWGWHMVKNEQLSIIEELMPAGTSEIKHYHGKAQQFFYILAGTAKFDVEGSIFEVSDNEGIHILPEVKHRIFNDSSQEVRFLVISQPPARGDRFEEKE